MSATFKQSNAPSLFVSVPDDANRIGKPNSRKQLAKNRIRSLPPPSTLTTFNRPRFFSDRKLIHPAIRKTFESMKISRSTIVDKNVRIAWISQRQKLTTPFDGLVNHVGNESEFVNKLRLWETLKAYERRVSNYLEVNPDRIPMPLTYDLSSPNNRKKLLIDAKHRSPWILKPTNRSRGYGISILKNLEEVQSVLQEIENGTFPRLEKIEYLAQKYITNPLLLNGKKFDIRSFLLIAGTNPLLALHDAGYVRISLHPFNLDVINTTAHLTNQCIQMRDERYESEKEDTVWSIEDLNEYLNKNYIFHPNYTTDWAITTLQKVQREILKKVVLGARPKLDRHKGQFGLYGCDFMIDDEFNVSLIEINMGPALLTNTMVLKAVIPRVLKESIKISIECFDKNRLGINQLPLIEPTKMSIVFSEAENGLTELPGPYSIEKYLRRVEVIGQYNVDLKKLAIDRCKERYSKKIGRI